MSLILKDHFILNLSSTQLSPVAKIFLRLLLILRKYWNKMMYKKFLVEPVEIVYSHWVLVTATRVIMSPYIIVTYHKLVGYHHNSLTF